MQFYLISDNTDTEVGLRLAGIEGEVVHDEQGVQAAFNKVFAREDIGIVLVTQLLGEMCPGLLVKLKKEHARPLIIEIPDRHGSKGTTPLPLMSATRLGLNCKRFVLFPGKALFQRKDM